MRDRDADTAWPSATDNVREERRYYAQNWRADVSAVVTAAGKMVESIKHSAYGVSFALPTGDTDSDGDWDSNDSTATTGTYDVRKDADLDGAVSAADVTWANSVKGTYQTLGRGVLSSTAVGNRKGYAGYENDGNIVRFSHVRNRVMDSTLGRWTRRDPMGYVDGFNIYQYALANALVFTDSTGLQCSIHNCSDLRPNPRHTPESNGCGSGILNPLIPERPFNVIDFTPCCDDHDLGYDSCNRNKREFWDDAFCNCVHAQCDKHTRGIKNFLCHILAGIYCVAVRGAGGFFYCDAQAAACICCDGAALYNNPDCWSAQAPREDHA